jgi:hypothetical protein
MGSILQIRHIRSLDSRSGCVSMLLCFCWDLRVSISPS